MSFNQTPDNKAGAQEKINQFGEQVGALEESEKFPGAKIISFKDAEARNKRYALSRSTNGELQGSSFELQEYAVASGEDGYWKNSDSRVDAQGAITIGANTMPKFRVGPTYQMHEGELEAMDAYLKERGITI